MPTMYMQISSKYIEMTVIKSIDAQCHERKEGTIEKEIIIDEIESIS